MQDLSRLSWAELLEMRRNARPEDQATLAPYEHRAYARETVAENPMMAPAFLFLTPGYQAYKAIRGGARTKPSLEQLKHGLLGTYEGVQKGLFGL